MELTQLQHYLPVQLGTLSESSCSEGMSLGYQSTTRVDNILASVRIVTVINKSSSFSLFTKTLNKRAFVVIIEIRYIKFGNQLIQLAAYVHVQNSSGELPE